jgi:hypothetical protein
MYHDGAPAFTRTDSSVNFNWRKASPGAPLGNDQFSVRWEGKIEPVINGVHTFSVIADNGAKLWVDGKLIVDLWRPKDSQRVKGGGQLIGDDSVQAKGEITLSAGKKVSIRLDYYEASQDANTQLLWSYPGQPLQFIPQSRLTPVSTEDAAATAQ